MALRMLASLLDRSTRGLEESTEVTFHLFSSFPTEVPDQIWDHFMETYEDNAAVVWKLVWAIDGVKQKEHGSHHHLFIRPFIKFDEPENESFTLLEVNCCPLSRSTTRLARPPFATTDMPVFLFWERKFERL